MLSFARSASASSLALTLRSFSYGSSMKDEDLAAKLKLHYKQIRKYLNELKRDRLVKSEVRSEAVSATDTNPQPHFRKALLRSELRCSVHLVSCIPPDHIRVLLYRLQDLRRCGQVENQCDEQNAGQGGWANVRLRDSVRMAH